MLADGTTFATAVDVISRVRNDFGFSAVELLFVLAIVGGMTAIGLPLSRNIIDDIKLRGDAQGLSSSVALAKLEASAKFTRARLFVNTATRTYRIETWNRTGTPGWVAAGDDIRLSDHTSFGFGAVAAAPPNTQTSLAQPPQCHDDQDVAISSTVCLIFNSRGISVLSDGLPATTQAVYLNSPSGVFGVILGATGQLQVWRTNRTEANSWRQQ